MGNYKFIDITQLPEDLWQDAKNLIAIDSNGNVIKAAKQDSYTKDEIDELLKDADYAIKEELNTKQDVITDLDSIRSGAALGSTALQSVPSEYATEQWVNEQGFLKEHQDISNLATKAELATKQDVISDLDSIRSGAALGSTALQSVPNGYATEQWVNEQGFLKEHQDISNLATKEELNTKQDVITDLETIRSGAALGATALQSVPSEYATEQWVNSQGFLKEHQDISNLATKSELNDKQDVLVSGTNIKTVNGTSLLGAGNIEINASADNVPTLQTGVQGTTNNYVYSSGKVDKYGVMSYFSNVITYSADNASIQNKLTYWGSSAPNFNNKLIINAATTSQAGLMTASDKSKLDGIDLTTKQDTLVSGTNIKTINGNSLLGAGDITIEGGNVDLTDYYTKPETNALVSPKLSQVTLTQAQYDALQTKENNVLYIISDAEDIKFKTINGEQITGEGNITIDTDVDLSNYATKSELNAKQDVISDLDTIRSGAAKGATALQSVPDTYALKSEIPDITTKQDKLISGSNIKTVNGTSLLGSGNIEIAKEWIGTQSEYDALQTKDNNTTYYITE